MQKIKKNLSKPEDSAKIYFQRENILETLWRRRQELNKIKEKKIYSKVKIKQSQTWDVITVVRGKQKNVFMDKNCSHTHILTHSLIHKLGATKMFRELKKRNRKQCALFSGGVIIQSA